MTSQNSELLKGFEGAVKKGEREVADILKEGREKAQKEIKTVSKIIGPGVVTGFSDDDPSGLGTYSITGAKYGMAFGWMMFFQIPMMIAIQEMCARIGIVTQNGLAGNIKAHFHRGWLYALVAVLAIANTVNIGADIAAMGSSFRLVVGGNTVIWSLFFALLIILLETFVSYRRYASILKWLSIALFSYVITAFLIDQDWSAVARETFFPQIRLEKEYLLVMVALLGTTISPYLFFWQASEELEEEVNQGKIKEIGQKSRLPPNPKELKLMRLDTVIGMIFTQAIAFFVMLTCASTLFRSGITEIVSVEQAAEALRPLAGDMAFILFAIGIIGAGLLGVPALTGSVAYAVSETFGWKEGLFHKFKEASGFYLIIIGSTLIGLLLNFIGISPIKALFYAAVLNGIAAIPLIAIVILVANNRAIMGASVNRWWSNWLGWITFAVILASVLLMIVF